MFELASGLQISWREILDVALVGFIYYRLILLFRGTRAVPVIYGLVLVLLLYWFSGELGLYTLNWFLANFLGSIFLVVIILFQADIRRALADFGRVRFFGMKGVGRQTLAETVRAASLMARGKIGALIIFEKGVPLGDVIETGVSLDAQITHELLVNIFWHNTPLHDGAVVIRGERIKAASCILPLSTGEDLSTEMGTRHRAALGVTEETDAVALVVSEERGQIALVTRGKAEVGLTETQLYERLKHVLSG